MEDTPSSVRTARLTLRAFGLLATVITVTELGAIYSAITARREVRRTASTAVTRIELVSRMGSAIDRERILVDAHIFERQASDMSALEQRITQVEDEFDRSVGAYRTLRHVSRNDSVALDGLTSRFAVVKHEVTTLLSLSRANQDVEAHAAMLPIGSHFDALDGILHALTRASEEESDAAVGKISAVQLGSIALSTVLALAAIGTAVALGAWASRVVGEREIESLRHARELEERNRDLDSFAARVAHDLRGPLTTIGLAGATLASAPSSEENAANILKRGVARMEGLIADLLALSRVASEAKAGVSDPAEIAGHVRDDLEPAARATAVVVFYDVPRSRVRCSPVLLRQLLSNLVENAIKYRRGEQSEVKVVGVLGRDEYTLTVADNGLGMEPEVAAKIFEPFYRSPSVSHLTGTGLGLSIVKRIVDASGGNITVASEPARGTTFTVKLLLET